MTKYEEFLNESKVVDFELGTICSFDNCYFNGGEYYINKAKAIVTNIKKLDRITVIDFVFYEGTMKKNSISLNSRQLRKIKILGKNMELLEKIKSNKISNYTISKNLEEYFRKIRFNTYAKLLDKTNFDIDENNPKNITYIDLEDFRNLEVGGDVEEYRKSIPCEEAFKILNPSYRKEMIEKYCEDYIYEATFQKKIKTGEFVKIQMSDKFNYILKKIGFYVKIFFSDITNIDIDLKNEKNIKYFDVNDKKIKSNPFEEIILKLNNAITKDSMEDLTKKYIVETKYEIDKSENKLVPLKISNKLDELTRRMMYIGQIRTHLRLSNFDIDFETPGNIICQTAENIIKGNNTKKSITTKEFIETLNPYLNEYNVDVFSKNIKNSIILEIKLRNGELRKFEASKDILKMFTKIQFYVGVKYCEMSRFDIDIKEPGNITCIPSIKITDDAKKSEEFRISLSSEKVFMMLEPKLIETSAKKCAEKFEKEVILDIKIKKGEVVLYKASEGFNYVLKSIGFSIKEQYLDCSSFDLVKDNIDMISFIPSKKGILENPEKFRQQTRAGRIFKKLNPSLTEVQIEKYVNLYRAEVEGFFNPPDIQVVTGDKIVYWYLMNRYAPGGGTLNNSCMRGDQAQQRVAFYGKFPDYIGLAVLIKNNKLYGRALIWKCDDGKVFMDRIYTVNAHDEVQFVKFGAQKNYIMRSSLMAINSNIKKRKVTIETTNEINLNNMPYLDTMSLRKYGWVDADGVDIPPSKNPKAKFVIRLESNYGKP